MFFFAASNSAISFTRKDQGKLGLELPRVCQEEMKTKIDQTILKQRHPQKKQKDMGTFKFLHKTSVYLGRGGTWFICICNAKIHTCFQNWAFRLLIFPTMQEN
jgi:hypothetical protein